MLQVHLQFLLSIDKAFGATINTENFTNNALSTFNENVTVVNTKTLFVNDIQDASGDAIDITAGTVTINGSLIDNSDARLKYDVDLLKSNCISMIKKFKPTKFKRKDRDDKDAIHIGYIADDLLKAVPKEISNVVHSSREYLGIEYTKVPILLHKALLEVIDKVEKLEKYIKEFKQEKSK